MFCKWEIIKADNRYLLWHAPSQLAQSPHSPQSHHVVRCKDCGQVWGCHLKMLNCSSTTRFSEISLIDRKSTRLNSSHQIISYAVFCLKKKKLSVPLSN